METQNQIKRTISEPEAINQYSGPHCQDRFFEF